MVYGFLGYARSEMVLADMNMSGVSYGLGIEAFVTERVTLGLEIARRDVTGTAGTITLGTFVDTVGLRVGFHF